MKNRIGWRVLPHRHTKCLRGQFGCCTTVRKAEGDGQTRAKMTRLKRGDNTKRRTVIRLHLGDERRDDFFQEMVVQLLQAAKRFAPAGSATWHTFASRPACDGKVRSSCPPWHPIAPRGSAQPGQVTSEIDRSGKTSPGINFGATAAVSMLDFVDTLQQVPPAEPEYSD